VAGRPCGSPARIAAFPEPTPASRAARARVLAARRAEEAQRQRVNDSVDLVLAQRRAFESGTKASVRMAATVLATRPTSGGASRPLSRGEQRRAGTTKKFVDLDFGEMIID
jgi:hypothetical protein